MINIYIYKETMFTLSLVYAVSRAGAIIRQLTDKLIIHNKLGYYKISDSVMLHHSL